MILADGKPPIVNQSLATGRANDFSVSRGT
jgi:hypothetical protein